MSKIIKLLEIFYPLQCTHRIASFTSRHPLTGEIDGQLRVEGYCCSHPKCNSRYLKMIGKDFLPCNNSTRFPRCCLLKDINFLKV